MRFYRLDATDTIIATDPEWDCFAKENGGPGAVAAQVLGRPLWEFVSGIETQAVLQQMFHDARRSAAPWALRYRCDSARQERVLRMTASPLDRGGLFVRHELVRSRPLVRDVVKDLSAATRLWHCSQCLSYSVTAHWLAHSHVGGPLPGQEVIDDVCLDCRATIHRQSDGLLDRSIA